MHNISPSQTMARRARQLFITGMIVLLLGLLVVALAIFCYVIPLSRDPWYSTLQVGLLCLGLPVGLVGGALIVRSLTLPSDNPAAAYTAEVLARGLDYRYTFIRNDQPLWPGVYRRRAGRPERRAGFLFCGPQRRLFL